MKTIKNVRSWQVIVRTFVFIGLFSFRLSAQNTIEELIRNDAISKIVIDGNQIFNIHCLSEYRKDIKIVSKTDGEYQDAFKIHSEISGGTLFIKLIQTPFYDIPDDKRNAHKVVAATLDIAMPQRLDVSIRSDVGSVKLTGNYKLLNVELKQGSCFVEGKATSAMIHTLDGDITVETSGAVIEATSNNGIVSLEEHVNSQIKWILKSINGDIRGRKLKE